MTKIWNPRPPSPPARTQSTPVNELPNDVRLRILGNEEILKLFTCIFIDLIILELVDLNS